MVGTWVAYLSFFLIVWCRYLWPMNTILWVFLVIAWRASLARIQCNTGKVFNYHNLITALWKWSILYNTRKYFYLSQSTLSYFALVGAPCKCDQWTVAAKQLIYPHKFAFPFQEIITWKSNAQKIALSIPNIVTKELAWLTSWLTNFDSADRLPRIAELLKVWGYTLRHETSAVSIGIMHALLDDVVVLTARIR